MRQNRPDPKEEIEGWKTLPKGGLKRMLNEVKTPENNGKICTLCRYFFTDIKVDPCKTCRGRSAWEAKL